MTGALTPGSRRRLFLARTAQVLVAIGLMVLVWQVADGAEAFRRLSQAEPLLLIGAALALTAQTLLSALRWQLTARQLGLAISRGSAIQEYYLSQVVNQTLPGGVLGDAGRAFRARQHAGLLASSQSVILERLAGQIALITVMAVALIWQLAVPGGVTWPRWILLAVGVVVVIGIALGSGLATLTRIPGRFGSRVGRLVDDIRLAWLAPGVWWRQLVYSLATAILNITAFLICAWSLGADVSVAEALVLVPLILLTMLIPVTVSGWGVREGAAAALFPLVGALPSEGLATSVAFGLVFLASSLPGIAFVRIKRQSAGTL